MTAGAAPTYVVTAPCVVVKGALGSAGIFYQDQQVRHWESAKGVPDQATPDELQRLLEMGVIGEVAPDVPQHTARRQGRSSPPWGVPSPPLRPDTDAYTAGDSVRAETLPGQGA